MKKLKKIMFLTVAVFALVLSSCSSNDFPDENPDENETTADFIKFNYKGKTYSYEPTLSTSLSMNIYGSEGIDNTYKKVSLWMPLKPTLGSHPIVFDLSHLETTYQARFTFMPDFNNTDATAGTLNITVLTDKKIEGTFSFSGTKNNVVFEVTEGSFSIERF